MKHTRRDRVVTAKAVAATVMWGWLTTTAEVRGWPEGEPARQAETKPSEAKVDLQARLTRITEQMERRLKQEKIPGAALAIVQGDRVIYSRGFGTRDVEAGLTVDEETLFAAGSTTKAFTATLIGMLVDEGKMSWDDSPKKYLPGFKLKDAEADGQVTIRDLLCHRTGLGPMDLLWASGKTARGEIIEAVGGAEPTKKLREACQYNNVGILIAGECAARAAGKDWDTLVAERIFTPLHMSSTGTTLGAARASGKLSLGYRWDEEESRFIHLPMRDLGNIAPAGAINSNVRDMAQWVRLQLARGRYNDAQLISAEQLEATWIPQIDMGGGNQYGLCWMVREHNGKRLVEHGGNIDGFAAQVAMLPDEGVGFVLLTNVTAAQLQQASINIVFDSLMNDLETSATAPDAGEYEEYVGKYLFDVSKTGLPFPHVTVLVQNGRLAVDVPRQTVYELKPPDAEGKWWFDFPAPIAIGFERNGRGEVNGLKLYQNGMILEMPREGMPDEPAEVAGEITHPLLGMYYSEQLKANVEVVMHHNRLALDVPGQMIFMRHSPDAEGKWRFRFKEDISVRFNRDETGAVVSITEFNAGQEHTLKRVEANGTTALPRAEEVVKLYRQATGYERFAAMTSVHATGTIDFVNQGVKGRIISSSQGDTHFADDIDLGKFGRIRTSSAGDRSWSSILTDQVKEVEGDDLESAKWERANSYYLLRDWDAAYETIAVTGSETINERPHYELTLTPKGGPPMKLYVDTETGLVSRQEMRFRIAEGMYIPVTMDITKYMDAGGVKFPCEFTMERLGMGRVVTKFDTIETNVELSPKVFDLTAMEP